VLNASVLRTFADAAILAATPIVTACLAITTGLTDTLAIFAGILLTEAVPTATATAVTATHFAIATGLADTGTVDASILIAWTGTTGEAAAVIAANLAPALREAAIYVEGIGSVVIYGLAVNNEVVERSGLGIEDNRYRFPFDLAHVGRDASPIGSAVLLQHGNASNKGVTGERDGGHSILGEGQLVAVLRAFQDGLGTTRIGGHLHDFARS
jgi:hypothetical protein